jgi:hypothetical protein
VSPRNLNGPRNAHVDAQLAITHNNVRQRVSTASVAAVFYTPIADTRHCVSIGTAIVTAFSEENLRRGAIRVRGGLKTGFLTLMILAATNLRLAERWEVNGAGPYTEFRALTAVGIRLVGFRVANRNRPCC